MAKVITSYSAKLASRGYIYSSPDINSSRTQYEAGTALTLPGNYAERMVDIFYPVDAPYGWVQWHIVGDINPNYTTTTDACTPPTSVTLSGNTLTITGGAGGDLNTFQGYGISWRDKPIGGSYGGWTADVVVNSTNTTVTYGVSVPSGCVREFRVRTLGSAGASYYSGYVTCPTTLTGNTAPSKPSIVFPASGKSTYCATPIVKVSCPSDPEGDTMTLYRKIDSGNWSSIGTLKSGNKLDTLPSLSTGSHTIYYKLADSHGLESGSVSITVTKVALTWTRTIATGTVISNEKVSHKADINQMLTVLNAQRGWYGNSTVALPGTVGRFSDWKTQMEQMETAIKANATTAGKTVTFATVPSYPTASVINAIRTQLTAF